MVGEPDGGFQGEELRADAVEHGGGSDVGEGGGRSEQDKFLVQQRDEFRAGETETGTLGLDGQDDGDGVGGPGADLDRVWDGQFAEFCFKAERFTDFAAKFLPVELEGGDVVPGKLSVFAAVRVALAEADGDGTG